MDTCGPDMNAFRDSCGFCVNGDTNPPEDADWWCRCKIGRKPIDNNVYKMCDVYQPRDVRPVDTMPIKINVYGL